MASFLDSTQLNSESDVTTTTCAVVRFCILIHFTQVLTEFGVVRNLLIISLFLQQATFFQTIDFSNQRTSCYLLALDARVTARSSPSTCGQNSQRKIIRGHTLQNTIRVIPRHQPQWRTTKSFLDTCPRSHSAGYNDFPWQVVLIGTALSNLRE